MSLKSSLIAELKYESANTTKALERLPEEHFNWRPHEKSYSLGELAEHITKMHSWLPLTFSTPEMDLSRTDMQAKQSFHSKAELLSELENNLDWGFSELDKTDEEKLNEPWTLRAGEHVIFTMPRKASIRMFVYNHIIHHRGQLMVYYRMLGIPVPGMYGPSGDEK